MLRRMGHTAKTAENGLDALVQLENAPIDVIITDINMPEMDGFALLEAIRKHPKWQHIPVVMLTDSSEWHQHLQEQGATGFLTKPVSSHQLMGKLVNLTN